jgi:hypothetical protein
MAELVLIPVPGLGVLALEREAFAAALVAGAALTPRTEGDAEPAAPRLLTSEQLGEQFSIPASWFEEAARRDEIPSLQVGKYRRFDLAEVMASLNPRIASARVARNPMIRRVGK